MKGILDLSRESKSTQTVSAYRARMWAFLIVLSLAVTSCSLMPPTPNDDQIMQAVTAFNDASEAPLPLLYKEIQVPHRYPGKAAAVVWVEDQSIQMNYVIAYNEPTQTFYVSGFSLYLLGEDGVYRQAQTAESEEMN